MKRVQVYIDDLTWKQLDDYAYGKGHKNVSGMVVFALLQCVERNGLTDRQKERIALREHLSPTSQDATSV